MSLRWLCLALLAPVGCAASAGSPASSPDMRSQMEKYFPLHDGHIYTYQLSGGGAQPEMFMVRVKRLGPSVAQLVTGASVRVLSLSANAVRREGFGTVLQAPLKPGASWKGDKGMVRVVNVDVRVHVPAGTFTGCVETVEEVGGDAHGTIETFFCPGVGIARMRVQQWQGSEHGTQVMDLRAFGPAMDLNK